MIFRLQSCVWELTLACCFSCKYCGSGGGKARDNELNTDECLIVAKDLARLGCKRVSLIGGEVFMRDDWQQIVRTLINYKIAVSIITNGFMLDESYVAKFKELQIESIAFSIDGLEEIHDRYRCPGSFKAAKQALFLLAESGINVSVITTLNKDSARGLPQFYEELQHWPIKAWQIQACSPMGNAKKEGIDHRFDHAKVVEFVSETVFHAPFIMGIADNIGYYTEKEGYLRGNISGRACYTGCRAGLSSVGIDSIGNVRGCESLYDDRFIEGNIHDTSLYDIWNSPDAFSYNRKFELSKLSGKCATCTLASNCAGGCRSYNYFTHGNLFESQSCVRPDDSTGS